MCFSDYYTYSIGHLSFIAESALVMESNNNGNQGSIFISLKNARMANKSILDSIKIDSQILYMLVMMILRPIFTPKNMKTPLFAGKI